MTVLVTGGSGFVGWHLAQALAQAGRTVRIFSRTAPAHKRLAANVGAITHVAGDIRDAATVQAAVRDCDSVFHTAAVPGIWGSRRLYESINVLGTHNVIAACQSAGTRTLVFTSSPSVVFDGRPHTAADENLPYAARHLCHYSWSKAQAERAVLAANDIEGLRTCALRPHLIWGPGDPHLVPQVIRAARTGRLRRIRDCDPLISTAHVHNVVSAHLLAERALQTKTAAAGEAYFICDADPIGIWTWIDQLLTTAGLPVVQNSMSARRAWWLGVACEQLYAITGRTREPPMTRFLARQLSVPHHYRHDKATRLLGYEPMIARSTGLAEIASELAECAAKPLS